MSSGKGSSKSCSTEATVHRSTSFPAARVRGEGLRRKSIVRSADGIQGDLRGLLSRQLKRCRDLLMEAAGATFLICGAHYNRRCRVSRQDWLLSNLRTESFDSVGVRAGGPPVAPRMRATRWVESLARLG